MPDPIYFQYFRLLFIHKMKSGLTPILFIVFLTGFLSLHAQPNNYGVPLITNYPLNSNGDGQFRCITQDHRGLIYLGDPDMGIMEFDGTEWRTIANTLNLRIRSITTGEDGVVYAGGEGDFGLLEADPQGQLRFRSLCDSALRVEDSLFTVWKTFFLEGELLFCTDQGIFFVNPLIKECKKISITNGAYNAFVLDKNLFCTDRAGGLMMRTDDHFESLPGADFFIEKEISGLAALDSGLLLVATKENGIHVLDPKSGEINSTFIERKQNEAFRLNQITALKAVGQKLLVSTRNQGLYVLDLRGRTREIISEEEGLPDNSISQIYVGDEDKSSGPVWTVHSKGISKLGTDNPIRKFTGDSGFEAQITDMVYFSGMRFISTLDGLYYQSQTSSGSSFRKVSKLSGEVYDLLLFQPGRGRSMLLAASESGIFVINRNIWVSPLIPTLDLTGGDSLNPELLSGKSILADPQRPEVIYTGLDKVVGLEYSRGRWNVIFRSPDFDQEISQMLRDHYGYLWVSTPKTLSRIDMELSPDYISTDYSSESGLPHDEDRSIFLKTNSRGLWVGTRNGFYLFDYFKEIFVPDSAFNSILPPGSGRIGTIYLDRDGDYWISFEKEKHGWTSLVVRSREKQAEVLFDRPFLRLPSSEAASGFYSDPEAGVWISKSKELYYFDKTDQVDNSQTFQTLIRKVVINGDSGLYFGARMELEKPRIDFSYNTLDFYWAATSFEGDEGVDYCYYLKGLSSSWSDWQKVSHMEFPNLKYGRYTLELKSKNLYGLEGDPASFSFVILRPWYASYPAILVCILLGVLLLYLLLKRRRK